MLPMTPLEQARHIVGPQFLQPTTQFEKTASILGCNQPYGKVLPPLNPRDRNQEFHSMTIEKKKEKPFYEIMKDIEESRKEQTKKIADMFKGL